MQKIGIKGFLRQHNDKSNLVLTVYLTPEQRQAFLLERGEQPNGMIKVVIVEDF